MGIEVIIRGNLVLYQNGIKFVVKPGDVFFLRRGMEHHYMTGSEGYVIKRYLGVGGSEIENISRMLGIWHRDTLSPSRPLEVLSLIKKATQYIQGPNDQVELSSMLYRLMAELGRKHEVGYPNSLLLAISYINRHLDCSITRKHIANAAGVSESHLNRLFRAHLGNSPLQYHSSQKMTWAKQLLQSTLLSVKEISSIIGFSDPYYFSSSFKKQCSCSPTQYRNLVTEA
jgi:AraC-like DNA-binding protein